MRPTNQRHGYTSDRFDESISLDDPNPGGNWSPSPRQIREWGAIIKAENDTRDGLTDESRPPAVQERVSVADSHGMTD